MRKLFLTFIATGTFIAGVSAQTLFTYGKNSVDKQEFLRIYQKNSMNKAPDFSEPALKEYLDLYSLFKMKVREAEIQKLDTLPSIERELNNYRKQLARNYLTDEQVTNRLVKEAYDRMKEEVHVAHILIMSQPTATSADTVAPYKKIDSIYNAIVNKKADFAEMAKQFSDDRGTKETGGDLGYITALQTIYPFENVVYSTPSGKVSKPFRTQFGYHIVKVLDRRPAKGEVKVAQILVLTPKSKGEEGVKEAKKKVEQIQAELKKGTSFTDLVHKYSEDKYSKDNDGVLAPIGAGKVDPTFEDAAFALKNPGDISKPVQTDYGFHIMKLIEKTPVKPFDSLERELKRKVENDSRAQIAKDIYMDKVKQQNGFKEYPANLEVLVKKVAAIPDTGKNANTFQAEDFKNMNQPVFELAGQKYLQSDLMTYAYEVTRGRLMGPKNVVVRDLYKMYVTTVLTDFQENRLVDENTEFRNLMKEYRDGIMLFELMDQNVWGKASRDTAGLKAFYEKNKSKYMWEAGFKGSVYHFKDEAAMKEGLKLIGKKDMKDEDIIKKLNSEAKADAVTIQRGTYEFSKFNEVPQSAIVKGKVSEPQKNADGTYTVVRAEEVYNGPHQKSLEDARGYVVAEYQDYLEKQWNADMRQKYPMEVNESVFKSMVK